LDFADTNLMTSPTPKAFVICC